MIGLRGDGHVVRRIGGTDFDDVDFWRTTAGAGGWVILARAGAGGEALTRKVREAIRGRLIGCDTDVTGLISIRPHAVSS